MWLCLDFSCFQVLFLHARAALVVAVEALLEFAAGPFRLAALARAAHGDPLAALASRGTLPRVAGEGTPVAACQLLAAAVLAALQCRLRFRGVRCGPLVAGHVDGVQSTVALHLDVLGAWSAVAWVARLVARVVAARWSRLLAVFLAGAAIVASLRVTGRVFNNVALVGAGVVATGQGTAARSPARVRPQLRAGECTDTVVPTAGQLHRLWAGWTGLGDHLHADSSQRLPGSNALALLGHNLGPNSRVAASAAYVAALETAVADLSARRTATVVALVRVSLLVVAFGRNSAGLVAGRGLG